MKDPRVLILLNLTESDLPELCGIFAGGALPSKLQEEWKVIKGSYLHNDLTNQSRILITNNEITINIGYYNYITELYVLTPIQDRMYLINLILQEKYGYKYIPPFDDFDSVFFLNDLSNHKLYNNKLVSPSLLQQIRIVYAAANNDINAIKLYSIKNFNPLVNKIYFLLTIDNEILNNHPNLFKKMLVIN
jgi:hypothetical protein